MIFVYCGSLTILLYDVFDIESIHKNPLLLAGVFSSHGFTVPHLTLTMHQSWSHMIRWEFSVAWALLKSMGLAERIVAIWAVLICAQALGFFEFFSQVVSWVPGVSLELLEVSCGNGCQISAMKRARVWGVFGMLGSMGILYVAKELHTASDLKLCILRKIKRNNWSNGRYQIKNGWKELIGLVRVAVYKEIVGGNFAVLNMCTTDGCEPERRLCPSAEEVGMDIGDIRALHVLLGSYHDEDADGVDKLEFVHEGADIFSDKDAAIWRRSFDRAMYVITTDPCSIHGIFYPFTNAVLRVIAIALKKEAMFYAWDEASKLRYDNQMNTPLMVIISSALTMIAGWCYNI